MGVYVAINSLGQIETRNRGKHFSSRIVPSGLSVEEGPYTALHNTAHLYSDQANRLKGIQRRLKPAESGIVNIRPRQNPSYVCPY